MGNREEALLVLHFSRIPQISMRGRRGTQIYRRAESPTQTKPTTLSSPAKYYTLQDDHRPRTHQPPRPSGDPGPSLHLLRRNTRSLRCAGSRAPKRHYCLVRATTFIMFITISDSYKYATCRFNLTDDPKPQQIHVAFGTNEPDSTRHPCFRIESMEALQALRQRLWEHHLKGDAAAPMHVDKPGEKISGTSSFPLITID